MAFQIPSVPPTTNKNIRFPNTLIAQVEEMIRGKESTFSAFVIAAVRAAVEEALCPLAGVTVLGIRLRPEADQLEVQVELEADGLRESTGLLLSL